MELKECIKKQIEYSIKTETYTWNDLDNDKTDLVLESEGEYVYGVRLSLENNCPKITPIVGLQNRQPESIASAYTQKGCQTAFYPITELSWVLQVAEKEADLRNTEYGKRLL